VPSPRESYTILDPNNPKSPIMKICRAHRSRRDKEPNCMFMGRGSPGIAVKERCSVALIRDSTLWLSGSARQRDNGMREEERQHVKKTALAHQLSKKEEMTQMTPREDLRCRRGKPLSKRLRRSRSSSIRCSKALEERTRCGSET